MAGIPAQSCLAKYKRPFFTSGVALARVVGRTDRFTPWEETLGRRSEQPLISEAPGVANIVAGACGAGRVVLFGSHPEFGFDVAMEDSQLPARMLLNAIAWQLAENGDERERIAIIAERESEADPARVRSLAAELHERTAAVRARGTDGVWLATEPRVLGFRPDDPDLDGGYHGVIALLEQSVALLDRALAEWDLDPGEPVDNPYTHMLTSPYHHVAGSYLAAVGRVGAAALLCE